MHLKPKKRLGQNFLRNGNIQRKIISLCKFSPQDVVLEIGAGNGEMTQLLAEKVRKVYALEIDPGLINTLSHRLKGYGKKVEIIQQDILKFRLSRYFSKFKNKIEVFGNIPYYITTPIIEYLIGYRGKIDSACLTVQKEFARRVVSAPGSKEFGSLSCFLQYYTRPEILCVIKKGSFFPVPKVDSCLLKLEFLEKPAVEVRDEELMFGIIRAAFSQRRKTLRASLKRIYKKERLEHFFKEYKINPDTRPEALSLADFANLADLY